MKKYFPFFLCLIFLNNSLAGESKKEQLYLKANSIIEDLKKGTPYRIEKGMLFWGKPLNAEDRSEYLIYNRDDVAKFKVSSQFVSYVEDDVRLLPNEKGDKVYPPIDYLGQTSNQYKLYNSYNFYLDNMFTSALNQIYSDELESILSPRYSVNFLIKPNLPLYFGGQVNFQSLTWKNDIESVRLNILSFGPSFKYEILKESDVQIYLGSSFEYCPIYSASTENSKDKFSAYIYGIELSSDYKTSIGDITFSTSFRNHHLTIAKSNRTDLELTPNEFNLTSFGVSIGYKTEWDL